MVLVCDVISQDHVIKGSCDFCGWEPLKVSHHPTKFGSHSHCGRRDKWFVTWSRKTTGSKGHATLRMGAFHGNSPPCQVWWL